MAHVRADSQLQIATFSHDPAAQSALEREVAMLGERRRLSLAALRDHETMSHGESADGAHARNSS